MTMRKFSSSSTIPLQYNYQGAGGIMSPSPNNTSVITTTTTAVAIGTNNSNLYDNQYNSLFGDPIPPPPGEFLDSHLDTHLYDSFRRNSSATTMRLDSRDSSLLHEFPRYNSFTPQTQRGNPPSSPRQLTSSNLVIKAQKQQGTSKYTTTLTPEIKILPNSSSNSSNGEHDETVTMHHHNSSRPREPLEVDSETIFTGHFTRKYDWNESDERKLSLVSEDSLNYPRNREKSESELDTSFLPFDRRFSGDSYSAVEWFKPSNDYNEWSKIPKLRPSSKNVMSINQQYMQRESPVAALIHDSNDSSSSGGDKQTLQPPPITSVRQPQPAIIRPKTALQKPDTDDHELNRMESSLDSPVVGLPPSGVSAKRAPSPVILSNIITTGSDYRVGTPRSHKKTSFTIISEKSPQNSRASSPSGKISPLLDHSYKDQSTKITSSIIPSSTRLLPSSATSVKPRSSPSPTRLKLPIIANNLNTSDDSPRPSVQFDMSSFQGRGFSMVPQPSGAVKGILQNKPDYVSMALPGKKFIPKQKVSSLEALPKIFGTGSGSLLRPIPKRLNKSSLDLYTDSKQEVKPQTKQPYINPNPTSRQPGLLQVINNADSLSKIPLPISTSSSLDDIRMRRRSSLSPIRNERRTSSTSPERRSSTLTDRRSSTLTDRRSSTEPRSSIASDRRSSNLSSIITSDYSGRRNSNSGPQQSVSSTKIGQRRQSIFGEQQPMTPKRSNTAPRIIGNRRIDVKSSSARIPRKVAKPTTLSPIIGTPNKEANLSSEEVESSIMNGMNSNSSKIPVRGSSNSRTNSRAPSVSNSRSNSPFKDFLSASNQNSRSPSRLSSRNVSRAPSRSNSRPTSRASSRIDLKPQSRSNSRLSLRGTSPPKQQSPSTSRTPRINAVKQKNSSPPRTRRKSISLTSSPIHVKNRNKDRLSPNRTDSRSLTNSRKSSPQRSRTSLNKNSPRRSPPRNVPISTNVRKTPNTGQKSEINIRRTPLSTPKNQVTAVKREPSNVKRSTSNLRKDSPKKEYSGVKKSTSDLKKESSNMNKSSASVKRETSTVTKGSAGLKREPSAQKLDTLAKHAPLIKKRTDSNLSKKLQKKDSYKNKKTSADTAANTETSVANLSEGAVQTEQTENKMDSDGKLIPLTKANVVSMTTAAITAQPVQITTAVTTQLQLNKTNSSGQLTTNADTTENEDPSNPDMLPVAILEKSQKTLETIQKTVTNATDEIHKTINENLTDLKTLETEVGKMADSFVPSLEKSESLKAIMEKSQTTTTTSTSDNANSKPPVANDSTLSVIAEGELQQNKSPVPPTQPVEAEVSVINQKKTSSDNLLHPSGAGKSGTTGGGGGGPGASGGMGTNHNNNNSSNTTSTSDSGTQINATDKNNHEDMTERVSERAISVLPEVECESANLQNYEDSGASEKNQMTKEGSEHQPNKEQMNVSENNNEPSIQKVTAAEGVQQQSTEAQGSSSSKEFLGDIDDDDDSETTNCCGKRSKCCRCFSKICIPCRRSQCSKCCHRNKSSSDLETVEVLSSSSPAMVSTTMVDEKQSCWKKFSSCCRKKNSQVNEENMQQRRMTTINEEPEVISSTSTTQIGIEDMPHQQQMQQNKCWLCLNKFFCCRATNKVNTTTGETEIIRKCCFCIPCKGRVRSNEQQMQAWQTEQRRESIISEPPAPQQGRFLDKLMCWKKKQVPPPGSRRTSMKQSIAPTNPPEDTRPKLHVDLVEFNSKMKGAIPVMPLWLAWFCMICNCIVPGLGTIFSGFFCICVGIPRFSQYDSAKARIGSLIINCIVGVSQLFCVLFCFVGWGWSIWWGTIMLKAARKLQKIKRVEQLELEEEQRQAAAAAATAVEQANINTGSGIATPSVVTPTNDKDVEAGKP